MRTSRSVVVRCSCLFAVLAASLTHPFVVAAEEPAGAKPAKPKPAAASALDDELFKDLNDGAPAPEKKPEKKPAAQESAGPAKSQTKELPRTESNPAAKKPLNPLDEELLKDLGGDAEAGPRRQPKDAAHGQQGSKPAGGGDTGEPAEKESDDPLVRLSRRVRAAEERLKRTDSGDQTQELQRGIVEDLEKLIAQIEQQKGQQSSSKSKGPPSGQKPGPKKPGPPKPGSKPGDKPSSNPTDSTEDLTAKKAERPETGKLKEMLEKVWGQLPERERQDVMQSSFDDFPTKYQYSIEQYFKTLLQRKD